MGSGRGRVEVPDRDPLRDYTDEENRRLTDNLLALLNDIDSARYSDRDLTSGLIVGFHRRLFDGVRKHAGHMRCATSGTMRLVFGPHRAVDREEVREAVDDACARTRRSVQSLHDNHDDPDYEQSSFHVAVWVQAEIIRIHPFEDGDGRVSRALTSQVGSANSGSIPCRWRHAGRSTSTS